MAFLPAAAFDLLRRSHEGGRLGHAYLISGADEAESRNVAAQLAGMVTGSGATFDHPDVHVAEPESKSRRIRIEQTRALERELEMRSLLGGRKVAVLIDADRMTNEAANAFLKTLEEPPGNSLLILTSTAPETLPDTILSRCITVPLLSSTPPALSPAQTALLEKLSAFAKEGDSSLPDVFRLVQTFLGLLRESREHFADENAASLKSEENQYRQTTDSSHWLGEREDFYKALTESRYIQQRFTLVDTLLAWWADVLRQQSGFHELDLPDHAPVTSAVAKRLDTVEALQRVAAIEDLRENLNRTGVQEQLAIEVAFLKAFG